MAGQSLRQLLAADVIARLGYTPLSDEYASAVMVAGGNDLPCGPFGSWRRAFARGTDSARRVQAAEGSTCASEGFADNASFQQYAWPGGYGIRTQLSGDGTKKTNIVVGLTPEQCAHMRNTWRTLALQALRGPGAAGALVKAEIIGSREAYQPIIRADGYYTSESEVIAPGEPVSLAATPTAISASGLVPDEIMQVAARFEIDWNGAASGSTSWVAIGGVWMGEGTLALRPPSVADPEVEGARYHRSTYPAGAVGANPMWAGALSDDARQNGVTSGGGARYGARFRMDADMIVAPTATCRSPATGANGVAWNATKEMNVVATPLNVSTSGVSALVSQGSNNVADQDELSIHLGLEAKV